MGKERFVLLKGRFRDSAEGIERVGRGLLGRDTADTDIIDEREGRRVLAHPVRRLLHQVVAGDIWFDGQNLVEARRVQLMLRLLTFWPRRPRSTVTFNKARTGTATVAAK